MTPSQTWFSPCHEFWTLRCHGDTRNGNSQWGSCAPLRTSPVLRHDHHDLLAELLLYTRVCRHVQREQSVVCSREWSPPVRVASRSSGLFSYDSSVCPVSSNVTILKRPKAVMFPFAKGSRVPNIAFKLACWSQTRIGSSKNLALYTIFIGF